MSKQSRTCTVAAWAEDFADVFPFDTEEQADAFSHGWSAGAGNYGAGKCVAYVLPRDWDVLVAQEGKLAVAEVEKAIARMGDDEEEGA